MKWKLFVLVLLVTSAPATCCLAKGRTIARVFWQDDDTATLHYGDLKKSVDGWSIEKQSIEEFPKLDPEQQSLVQMQTDEGLLIVGVRDAEDGSFGSGWIAIESGVIEEPHGDHSHWRYIESPKVAHSLIDTEQGNPAHVYQYEDTFVLANDKSNGFTLTSARRIRDAKVAGDAASFHSGGNGHITLAVSANRVAYATWIAPAGDDKGRIDVVGLGPNLGKTYSIHCPSGLLHGAVMNSGRAFFAPSDGICWVDVDEELDDAPDSVEIHHLSLGKDKDETPLRTGAFVSEGRHVVFVAGKGPDTQLCSIEAAATEPKVSSLAIDVTEGESITTPVTMKSRYGDRLAVMFGQNQESPEEDRALLINLDPNRDGRFDDAALVKAIEIGPNQMEGHSGYHAAAMLPDRRHAVISNPGDGSLWIVTLNDFEVVGKLPVGGTPTRLLSIGG